MMDVPNIPLGDPPGMDTDKLGSPLNPDDFAVSNMIAHDPAETDPNAEDPILMAGYFQGDIIMQSKDELMDYINGPKARNIIKDMSKKWTNGVVPYVLSDAYTTEERKVIATAMDNYHKVTCIRFKPRSTEPNYIHIYKASGCSSSVGMKGGQQAVTLGPRCIYVGVVMHELMHALGMWHEHSRFDRDSEIRILTQNIQKDMEYNFKAYGPDQIQTLGLPYDTDSIMHYGDNAFAVSPGLKTIQPLKAGTEIGQRRGLSKIDKEKLNKLYCGRDTTTVTAPLPAPNPSTCKDIEANCKAWALAGECVKNPVYMEGSCCDSCAKNDVCMDNEASCGGWAKIGECTKNPDYMTVYCPQSCGMCGGKGGGGGGGGACGDFHADCKGWASTRQCQVNPSYMLKNCAKSCGVC